MTKNLKSLKILEVNNIDLPGRRFNGYDLQEYINLNTGHSAKQIVKYKISSNKNVVKFFENNEGVAIDNLLGELESEILSVHSQLSLTSPTLLHHKEFAKADLVHYHLVHNTKLSLSSLVELFSCKPTVFSIHDPWVFTGRCVHPENCDKWLSGCKKCDFLNTLFPFKEDNCKYLWMLKEKIYKNIDADIVVSTPFMLDMLKRSPLTKHFKNVHVIPFGVDLDKFSNKISKKEARKKFGVADEDIVLFFRAQAEFKGTEYLVDALKQLKTKKNITLLSCDVKGLLDSLKGKYNIIELGQIEDQEMVAAYNACDIFMMPSIGESFGLMAIEAMACSRPVVVFNNTALPSVTFAPTCGVLVENKNATKLMEAIKWLVEDEEERNKRGKLGRKLAKEHYNIDEYNKKMVDLYEEAYRRQKNKKVIKNSEKIDFSSNDVQNLIRKLKEITNILFVNKTPKFSIFKYEDLNHEITDDKIDYSLDDVQNLLNQYNNELYKVIDQKENFISISINRVKTLMDLAVHDRAQLKSKVSNKLRKYPIIHRAVRGSYKVVRHSKNFVLKDKILNRKINDLQNQNNNLNQLVSDFNKQNSQLIDEIANQNSQLTIRIDSLEEKRKELSNNLKYINQIFSNDQKNIFYYHGGSGNHGCEALVRTLILINDLKRDESCLYSYGLDEDYKFKINEIIKYIKPSNLDAEEIDNDYFSNNAIAFSIGGDNYCGYDYGTKRLAKYNKKFNDRGVKTALVGCSIEPDVLEHNEVLDDLNRFSLITARETITYEALLKAGINRNTHLIPDSAFTLETIKLPLPKGFEEGNTIGLNVSNLVQIYDNSQNITYNNYKNLIDYIINKTKYQIALIPHVVQKHNDDLGALTKLYDEYKDTHRVVLINECNCNEIKGYISRCKIFVGARTHATIAAYSTCVPTLVLGYSVKSRGIAKDIFGTNKNYVLPVQSLKKTDELTKAFVWIETNYSNIKKHLEDFMPNYIKRCYDLKSLIDELKNTGVSTKGLASAQDCSGCSACMNICPSKCITMEPNNEGFLYPKTDYTKCNNCNLCKEACPANKEYHTNKNVVAYAAKNKDLEVRLNSSSGGLFRLLAEETIKNEGIVFGAGFDDKNVVCHMGVDNLKDLYKLQGSKYVQSAINDNYRQVQKYLRDGKEILFSGTPCQVQGLKSFLKKEYENLICIDVVCHGTPSPKVFEKYCGELETINDSKITNINFRSKDKGWKIFSNEYKFINGYVIKEDLNENIYMQAFLKNLTLRNSCYDCRANNFKSGSDITLADFWGIENIHPELDDDKGCSLVIINTKKGETVLSNVKDEMQIIKVDIEDAKKFNYCLTKSVLPHENRQSFFNKLDNKGIIDLMKESLK